MLQKLKNQWDENKAYSNRKSIWEDRDIPTSRAANSLLYTALKIFICFLSQNL